MQLIGIYLGTHDNPVSKNLKENWYPFGNFDNCHGLENFSKIFDQVTKNQSFINMFYSISKESLETEKQNKLSINLNCIIGKNGSGKSSVLSLLYRTINNLAVKLKELLQDYNKVYEPLWAYGFNAELYYEINKDNIGCIEVFDNDKILFDAQKDKPLPVRLTIYNKDGSKNLIISDGTGVLKENENAFLQELGESIFYTVGTNYSLYINSIVRDEYNESKENWMSRIYHKNDGYFTPLVLVPYRKNSFNNDSSVINTEKELKLANERVNTLAILLKASPNKSSFIDGFMPERVKYELKEHYEQEIKGKIISFLSNGNERIEEYTDIADAIQKLTGINKDGLFSSIREIWKAKLKNTKLSQDKLKNTKLSGSSEIFGNILLYLSYKTIKMSCYYDKYKKYFPNDNLFGCYDEDPENCKKHITKMVEDIIIEDPNFMNLKIKQCIDFLDNGSFYLEKINKETEKGEISIDDIIKTFPKGELNYDSVFKKLLPPIFKKEYYYKKTETDNKDNNDNKEERTIAEMSSGEQQMLYSLSYAVYHMKNAASNQYSNNGIPYRNMNLIFDEAELYYHPEYQRQFIDKLLGILERSHFENDIDSINITIVTHSPFMLSDIPSSNILALKDGKRDNSLKMNTLGANIYDLLANQFFMESAIGGHVEKIINEIVQDYYIKQAGIDKKRIQEIQQKYSNTSFYDSLINKIGDDYLHDTLFDMVNQIREISYTDRRIMEYENKLERLRNEKN